MTPDSAVQLAQACRLILDHRNLQDVAVEVAEHEMMPSYPAILDGRLRPEYSNDYGVNPPLGISLGLASEKEGSGTVGFYIRVTFDDDDQNPRYFAVTCSHVLSSDGHFLSYITEEQGLQTESPSPKDHLAWRETLTAELEVLNGVIEKLVRQGKTLAANDSSGRLKNMRNLRQADGQHAQLQSRLGAQPNRRFGRVFLTSGLQRISPSGYLMDWGLVALDPKRFHNMSAVTNPPNGCSPSGLAEPTYSWSHARLRKVPRMTADIELQLRTVDGEVPFVVHKLGRTTSATEGRLNEIALRTITYQRATTSGNLDIESKVLVVLNTRFSTAFADVGDSGSLVVDKNGSPVGLLIACQSALGVHYRAALVTPIAEIMSDMKAAIERVEREKSGSNRPAKIEFL